MASKSKAQPTQEGGSGSAGASSAGEAKGAPATAVSEGATEAERSFNRQVDTLTRFYAKHDGGKSRQECAGIIRK